MGDRVKDKVVMVTGAASGIGRATALALAREGAKLSLSDVDESGGTKTLEAVRGAGGEALFLRADVTDEAQVGAMVAKTVERFGRLDAAFNNAGIENDPKPTTDMTLAVFERVLAVNVRGVFLCMRAEIPAMLRQGKGSIVNTASVAGLLGAPGLLPYVASKHAVIGMTRTTAAEFTAQGIRVNAVCPGLINTPMLDRLAANLGKDRMEAYVAMTPIRRLAEPGEVAEAVVWLCSDASSFVTGSAMTVDGGFSSV
ncbi:MAG TPA: glucose 1-dehydrogenase [Candidatus Binatia bacterium]|nr:glucose 1-dehydrogenase [Candidatus Binatia bacterium]